MLDWMKGSLAKRERQRMTTINTKTKTITKTKTKTQKKTRIVMMRQQCQIAGRGSCKEKGGLLD